jgi:hypothetical protein
MLRRRVVLLGRVGLMVKEHHRPGRIAGVHARELVGLALLTGPRASRRPVATTGHPGRPLEIHARLAIKSGLSAMFRGPGPVFGQADRPVGVRPAEACDHSASYNPLRCLDLLRQEGTNAQPT